MTRSLCLLILAAMALHAAEPPKVSRWWAVSAIALAAANAADVTSSWHGYEANPLAHGADGRFSPARGIALKVGFTGGALVLQRLILRRHHRADKAFAAVNLGAAGVVAGVAMRNRGVK
jgi:hypothetical protein